MSKRSCPECGGINVYYNYIGIYCRDCKQQFSLENEKS